MIERILLALGMMVVVSFFIWLQRKKDRSLSEKAAINMGCKVIGKDKKGRRIWGHSFNVK